MEATLQARSTRGPLPNTIAPVKSIDRNCRGGPVVAGKRTKKMTFVRKQATG